MRVALFADLRYLRSGSVISTTTPFVSWINGLAEHFDELVVVGRLDPEEGAASNVLAGERIRFVPLRYYPSLHAVGGVVAGAAHAAMAWREALSRCDAAVLFGPHPYAVLFGIEAGLARKPVVVGVRQDFARYIGLRSSGFRRQVALPAAALLEAAHRRMARAGGVIAVGDEMARRYEHREVPLLKTGISLVRSSRLAPFADLRARAWPGERRVLAAGRLDPEKNPLLLLDIAGRLRRLGPWTLDIAGTGSLFEELSYRVAALHLDATVRLHGRLGWNELQALFAQANVFVHVSRTEGQPQVLFEAAAAGVPIVATDVGGVRAALDGGRRGLLVPPDDADAVVAAISELDCNPDRRRELVEAAWWWASRETLESQTERAAEFVGQVVASRSRRQ